jgi:hypothetical protein
MRKTPADRPTGSVVNALRCRGGAQRCDYRNVVKLVLLGPLEKEDDFLVRSAVLEIFRASTWHD